MDTFAIERHNMNKIESDALGILYLETYDGNGELINRTSYAPTTAEKDLPEAVKAEAKKLWTEEVVSNYVALISRPLFAE
jgi:hypothetical protein